MPPAVWLVLFIPYCLITCEAKEQATYPEQKLSSDNLLINSLLEEPLNCNDNLPAHISLVKCNKKRSISDGKSSVDDDLPKRDTKLKKVRFFSWGGKRNGNDDIFNNNYLDEFEFPQSLYDPNVLDYEQELMKRAQPGGKVRVPFHSWGGKRKEQLKKVPFFSWGGKRSPEIMVKPRKLAPRVPFFSWGGKRSYIEEDDDYDM